MRKPLFSALALATLAGCIYSDSGFNQDPEFLESNSIYLSFYDSQDSVFKDVNLLGYTGFALNETSQQFMLATFNDMWTVYLFPFPWPLLSYSYSYMILPLNPEFNTNTFTLFRASGNDSLTITGHKPVVVFDRDKQGYEFHYNQPNLDTTSLSILSEHYDFEKNILYLTVEL